MSQHTGARLVEIAGLLWLFAGVWLAAAQVPQLRFATGRTIVGALAIAASGLLLIVAVHWGHFA